MGEQRPQGPQRARRRLAGIPMRRGALGAAPCPKGFWRLRWVGLLRGGRDGAGRKEGSGRVGPRGLRRGRGATALGVRPPAAGSDLTPLASELSRNRIASSRRVVVGSSGVFRVTLSRPPGPQVRTSGGSTQPSSTPMAAETQPERKFIGKLGGDDNWNFLVITRGTSWGVRRLRFPAASAQGSQNKISLTF